LEQLNYSVWEQKGRQKEGMAVSGYIKHPVWLRNLFIIKGCSRYRWPSFLLVHSSMIVAQCPQLSGSPEAALVRVSDEDS